MHMRSGVQRRLARDVLTNAQVQVASATFRTLADPTRLRLLYALVVGPASVNALALTCGVSPSAMSHQLQRLRDQGLVSYTRDGAVLRYELLNSHVANLCREALYLADHLVSGSRHR